MLIHAVEHLLVWSFGCILETMGGEGRQRQRSKRPKNSYFCSRVGMFSRFQVGPIVLDAEEKIQVKQPLESFTNEKMERFSAKKSEPHRVAE